MTFRPRFQLTQDGIPDEPASSISDEATKRHHHHRLSRTSAEHAVVTRSVTVTPDRIIAAPIHDRSDGIPQIPPESIKADIVIDHPIVACTRS